MWGDMVEIDLPKPELQAQERADIWEILQARRSLRNYTHHSLSLHQLSLLLWATQGITFSYQNFHFRAAPSAGALYPIETYVMINSVEHLPKGIYNFDPLKFTLTTKKDEDLSRKLSKAALGQTMIEKAACVFIWTVIFHRSAWKYRDRAYRYSLLDCGHICQNLYLGSTAMGLGCCAIGAFHDEEVNGLLGVDGKSESAIYLATIGYPAK